MVPIQHRIRQGKRVCDLYKREVPPIRECQFPISTSVDKITGELKAGRSHWFDLCADCAAIDQQMKDGFLVGIHRT